MLPSRELPAGTITLMFCDIEGSTALARMLGDGWPEVLAAHRATLRNAVGAHGGIELGTEGDGLVAVFPRAREGRRGGGPRAARANGSVV